MVVQNGPAQPARRAVITELVPELEKIMYPSAVQLDSWLTTAGEQAKEDMIRSLRECVDDYKTRIPKIIPSNRSA